MGFPDKVTVGSLMAFLQEELNKGNVVPETAVFVEAYTLTQRETELKPLEKELDYHIPDDSMDDILSFRMGVWQCVGEGKHKSDTNGGENTVALSIYIAHDSCIVNENGAKSRAKHEQESTG